MRKAIYSGSFDPITYGHLDIIKRAAEMYDELIVGILNNVQKSPLFSPEVRVKIVKEAVADIPNVRVECFSGLMADYAGAQGIRTCVKGLRNTLDLEYEMQESRYNWDLSKGKLDTVFLISRPKYSHISSSGVREVISFGGDITSYVPPSVVEQIMNLKREREQK